jgi:hypothetical protein
MIKCPYCKESHNGTEHFRLIREAAQTEIPAYVIGKALTEHNRVVKDKPAPVTTHVTTPVTTLPDVTTKKSSPDEIARVMEWKRSHREKYNEYMREYRKVKRG